MSSESSYRYERKFVIPNMSVNEAEAIIKLHPVMFYEIFYPRFVNNIYLDTLDSQSYVDNIDGVKDRKKVRIRWYGDLFGNIDCPVLEIKIKKGLFGKKESYPLAPFMFDQTFKRDTILDIFKTSDLPELLNLELQSLEPSLVNRYKRKYFLSLDRKFRVTIDSEVTFYHVNLHYNSFMHYSEEIMGAVIELKYDKDNDKYTNSISEDLPWRLTRNSKYVIGKDRLWLG